MSDLRGIADWLRRTPAHPQWLLPPRAPPAGIEAAQGVVLDIGSASKWIEPHLPHALHYIALDYPVTGGTFYSDCAPHVYGSASQLPLADASVDTAICLEVIEHLEAPRDAWLEIARVLKPGGRAWVSVPFMYPIHNAPHDFQRYTEFGLKREVRASGLELVMFRAEGHSVRAAGLLLALALAGGVHQQRGILRVLLLPLAVAGIVVVNLLSRFLAAFWPDWGQMPINYHLHLKKPDASVSTD